MSVPIGCLLDRKGRDVFTVHPDASVLDAARHLRRHNVGALVVSRNGADVAGIISERDIVRRLASDGSSCLDRPVAEVMTTTVTTCSPLQTADDLLSLMTTARIRHVPVVEDARMIGLVSIGDVVRSYMDDLELKAEALTAYVTGSAY